MSVWTAFCEVAMPASVESLVSTVPSMGRVGLPVGLVQLEEHLKSPIRMHNIVKRWQRDDTAQGASSPDQKKNIAMKDIQTMAKTWIAHTYAEGPDLTLADLLLYPCVRIAVGYLEEAGVVLLDHLPTVSRWLSTMNADESILRAWSSTIGTYSLRLSWTLACKLTLDGPFTVDVPLVSHASLYKDPCRQTIVPLNTDQVNALVEKMTASRLWPERPDDVDLPPGVSIKNIGKSEPPSEDHHFEASIDWAALPEAAHPKQGQVPGAASFQFL